MTYLTLMTFSLLAGAGATIAQPCPTPPVGTARIAEIAEFQLAPGMEVAEFKARAALSLTFLCATDGFIRRTLSMGEDGRWTDHVEWASLEQAQAALAVAMQEASLAPFMQAIDPDSLSMRHQTIMATQ